MPFQTTSSHIIGRNRSPYTPHPHTITSTDSVWTVPLSVALTHGISLISFPAGTKTFQFPAFPNPKGFCKKSYSDIYGSTSAFDSPQLFAACHVLHRHLSQVIHLTACLVIIFGTFIVRRQNNLFSFHISSS